MDNIFVNTMIDKVDKLDKRMEELEEKHANIPDYKERFDELSLFLIDLKKDLQTLNLPISLLVSLNENLQKNTIAQNQPKVVVNRHHFHWVAYVAGGLFLILCLVCSGWLQTAGKLDDYIENDTKYRYLQLEPSLPLQKSLAKTDSIFDADPDLRNRVRDAEERLQMEYKLSKTIKESQLRLEQLRRDSALLKK